MEDESIIHRALERVGPTGLVDADRATRGQRLREHTAVFGPGVQRLLRAGGHGGQKGLGVVRNRSLVPVGARTLQLAQPLAVEVSRVTRSRGLESLLEDAVGCGLQIFGHAQG